MREMVVCRWRINEGDGGVQVEMREMVACRWRINEGDGGVQVEDQ